MNNENTRVHIIGGPGSGKTYLATALSMQTGIEPVSLDDFFWDNRSPVYNTRRPADERDRLLQEAIAKENWIVEGASHSWVESSFQKADIIILLNVPVWIRHYRIIKRYFCRKLGLSESAYQESVKSLFHLLTWNQSYNYDNLKRARQSFCAYKDKLYEFSTADKALKMLMKTFTVKH